MLIIHPIDEFFKALFPDIDANEEAKVMEKLKKYYTIGPFVPKVTIEGEYVQIEINTDAILNQKERFDRLIQWCEKGDFKKAKPLLEELIQENPSNSEYHRIMGQIYSDQGDQDAAIDSLIDALRWDPKNHWALVMMGNIFAKFKEDIPTAMQYYDQALIVNPKDNITINNIGANLMQEGNKEEAKKYFHKAMEIDNEYPNTHYALSIVADLEGRFQDSFNSAINAVKYCTRPDGLYKTSAQQAFDAAIKVIETDAGQKVYKRYKSELEKVCSKRIEIEKQKDIPTAAKIEVAENHQRDYHLLKYNPEYPAVEHLIMHELVHLDFINQARQAEVNQLFISNSKHKERFIRSIEPTIKRLTKMGIPEKSVTDFCSKLFDGLNRQVFNVPIDLFIEDLLYQTFPELRPYQFISQYNMIQESIKSVTDEKVIELTPSKVVSKSKVYNLVVAIQFKNLFGLDLCSQFKANSKENKMALSFWKEYQDYRDDRQAGEEYDLIQNWAEDLKLNQYFKLVEENKFRNKKDPDSVIKKIEEDPLGLSEIDPEEEEQMRKFLESQEDIGLNMAVVMYMVDSLKFFEGMQKEKIKDIAFDIAMQGRMGFNPSEKGYSLSKIPGKSFTGYHILAYYYVSWALAIPEMLNQLQLPFEEEYKMAQQLTKQ